MTTPKEKIVASIEHAKADLQQALACLDQLRTVDSHAFGLSIHALNNYLMVTGGFVTLLSHALETHPDPDIHAWLSAVEHASDLMAHTVRQLRTDRIAETKLVREKVDMVKWVERVSTYYQGFANRKRIHIIFESAVGSPAYVWTDRVVGAVVVDNLLSNAIKYSEPNRQVWVRILAEPAHLVCSVQDEGPGLHPEDQAQLFQRGVRLGAVPTGGESSTGFGLAIAKELIEQLDGAIWCVSEFGQGACFAFRLPRFVEEEHMPGMAGPSAGLPRAGSGTAPG